MRQNFLTVTKLCFTLSTISCSCIMLLILGMILRKQRPRCTRMLAVMAMRTHVHPLTRPTLLISMTEIQNGKKRVRSLSSHSIARPGLSSNKKLSRLLRTNAPQTPALPELFQTSSALLREGEKNASFPMSVVGVPALLVKLSALKPPLPPCFDGQGFSVPAPLLLCQLL